MILEQLFPNGWGHYLAGGLLLGVAVSLLFIATGLIGGMSSVFSSTWSYVSRLPFFQQTKFVESRNWRLVYAAGLILGAALWAATMGSAVVTQIPLWQLAVGGFIAGFGARMSNGCTSGHGICGLASLQMPSLTAVITFLATAIVTANIVKSFGGA
ncbi:MAG: YeeE/YedE family protein [Burkholderiaceae bacterium]